MAQIIRSMNDLNKILESRIEQALKMTQNEIFKVFQKYITEYYKEPVFRDGTSAIPMMYKRTYKLLNSLIKTDIIKNGNVLSCTVEIDPNYLNYEYMGGMSGLDVMLSAEQTFHGWSVEGDMRIWSDSLAELGLEHGIKYLMKSNLKKCGVPIK